MLVQKKDANGNLMFDTLGQPVMVEVEGPIAEPPTNAADAAKQQAQALETARKQAAVEARKQAEAEIEKERKERLRLEAELASRDKAAKEQQLAALPPEQRHLERMKDIEHALAQERAIRVQEQSQMQNALRSMSLVAYRERAVRDVPAEVADFVSGNDEQEIDASVERVKGLYTSLQDRFRQAAPPPAAVPMMAIPPNPAFPMPAPFAHGFPTPTNPLPVMEASTGQQEDGQRQLLTEQGVRSGKYSGELREKILAQYRGAQYSGAVGNTPRHQYQPTPHVQQFGQQVPQGLPTPPVMNPNMYQGQPQQMAAPPQAYSPTTGLPMMQPYAQQPQVYPQQPQYAQQPQMAPQPQYQQADPTVVAVQRTHQGINPIVQGDAETRQALQDAQQFAASRGISSPIAAFQQRFSS